MKFSEIFKYEINNTRYIFTDGLVTPGAPTLGFALLTSDGEYSLKYQFLGSVSSFCVESFVILETIKLILEKNWPKTSLYRFSIGSLCCIGKF